MGYKPQPCSLLCRNFITCKYLLQLLMMALVIHTLYSHRLFLFLFQSLSSSYHNQTISYMVLGISSILPLKSFIQSVTYEPSAESFMFLRSRGTPVPQALLRNVNFFFSSSHLSAKSITSPNDFSAIIPYGRLIFLPDCCPASFTSALICVLVMSLSRPDARCIHSRATPLFNAGCRLSKRLISSITLPSFLKPCCHTPLLAAARKNHSSPQAVLRSH